MKYSLLICLAVGLMFSCKSKSQFTPTTFEDAMITFGNYGGFAGRMTSYTILENGQFFKNSEDEKNFQAINKLSKSEYKDVFKTYEKNFQNIELDIPGNLTYFMKYVKDGKSHEIKWGGYEEKPNQELKNFYSKLMVFAKEKGQITK